MPKIQTRSVVNGKIIGTDLRHRPFLYLGEMAGIVLKKIVILNSNQKCFFRRPWQENIFFIVHLFHICFQVITVIHVVIS